MKAFKRNFTLRTALLTALTVALLASAAVFLAVSALDETVSPSDVSGSDGAYTFVSGSDGSPLLLGEAPESLGEPVITMITEKAAGETLSGSYLFNSPEFCVTGQNVYVDYGDGTPVEYPGDKTVKGSNIKIYGDNITSLFCTYNQLTSLNVSGCTSLTEMDCSDNPLTSLDVSNNTALRNLACSSNQLASLEVSNNKDLQFLNCCDNQLTSLDVTKNTVLEQLICHYNQLTELDVSNNTKLFYLNCRVNQLTVLNMSNQTALSELDCGENQLTSLDMPKSTTLTNLSCDSNQLNLLDITNNTALQKLDCQSNQLTTLTTSNNTNLTHFYCGYNQLSSIDVSLNTNLIELGCDSNPLYTLDVSNNISLTKLSCWENNLTSLNVSNNSLLTELNCWDNQLDSLDVSHNTALKVLNVDGNQLTSLNVSNNPALTNLRCFRNNLTSLDLSNNHELVELCIAWNHMMFSDVNSIDGDSVRNRIDSEWGTSGIYVYAPQTHIIPSTVKPGEAIDLSSEYDVDGTITQFTWLDSEGNVVMPATANGGIFTFDESFAGKTLVCKMSNEKLPDFAITDDSTDNRLTTTEVTIESGEPVSGQPVITITTNKSAGEDFCLSIDSYKDVYVDFGDNNLEKYESQIGMGTSGTLKGNTVRIYGSDIDRIDCSDNEVTSIDISGCPGLGGLMCGNNLLTELDVSHNANLNELICSYNQLTSIDVSHNPCLMRFDCNGNQLTSLDVRSNPALDDFNCSENQLTSLDITQNTELRSVGCYNNQLTGLDVSKNTILEYLSCDSNELSGLDLSHNTELVGLNCAFNSISSLDLANNTGLTELSCYYNQLSTLDVSKNTALEWLECGDNRLTSLDVSMLPSLTNLDCGYNSITALDVSKNTALTTLNCGENQLTSLNVSANTALVRLNCYGNRLTSLDVSNNKSLVKLSCEYNMMPLSAVNRIDGAAISGKYDEEYDEDGYYFYAPQTHVIPSSVKAGEAIDLSSEYSLDGTITQFTWLDSDGIAVTPATANGGVFTFGEDAVGKTLVCKMTNAKLPDFCTGTGSYEEYDNDGNPTGNMKSYEFDNRLTTTEVTIEEAEEEEPTTTTTTTTTASTTASTTVSTTASTTVSTTASTTVSTTASTTASTTVSTTASTTASTTVSTTASTTTTATTTTTKANDGNDGDSKKEDEPYYDLKVVDEDDIVSIDKAGHGEGVIVMIGGKARELRKVKDMRLTVSNIDESQKEPILDAIAKYNDSFDKNTKDIAFYDIDLTDGTHTHIAVTKGAIAIRIKYPETMTPEERDQYVFRLYHQKEDGTVEEIKLYLKANDMWFYATDFSPYVLTWNQKAAPSANTGESATVLWTMAGLLVLSLAGAGWVLYRRRKQTAE